MATSTAEQFAHQLLGLADNGGIKGLPALPEGQTYDTPGNRLFIEKWIARENTKAKNNPLATTYRIKDTGPNGQPKSYPLPGNTDGVQQYVYFPQGVDATANTLGNGFYGDILMAIASGNAEQLDAEGKLSSGLSKWSGGSYTSVSNESPATNPPSLSESSIQGATGTVVPELVPGVDMPKLPSWMDSLGKALGWLTVAHNWIRVGEMAIGFVLALLGAYLLIRNDFPSLPKVVPIPV